MKIKDFVAFCISKTLGTRKRLPSSEVIEKHAAFLESFPSTNKILAEYRSKRKLPTPALADILGALTREKDHPVRKGRPPNPNKPQKVKISDSTVTISEVLKENRKRYSLTFWGKEGIGESVTIMKQDGKDFLKEKTYQKAIRKSHRVLFNDPNLLFCMIGNLEGKEVLTRIDRKDAIYTILHEKAAKIATVNQVKASSRLGSSMRVSQSRAQFSRG